MYYVVEWRSLGSWVGKGVQDRVRVGHTCRLGRRERGALQSVFHVHGVLCLGGKCLRK